MSPQPGNDDAADLQEAAEEEEVLKLEEEVEQMAQKVLEYRTTLPDQLTSTLSSLLASQRPVLPTHLIDEGAETETRTPPGPDSEAGVSQGSARENMALSATDGPEEAEKIQLLKQKISSNASALPVVLNRMKEYMARIDKLESSNGIIHPAFKRKRNS
ncbi:hypothetical protein Salat_2700600 [Sesamum alatum]|uniref:Uncharacterized protein n=1 Tax=Sesamum alatum TaxID=300844 RepID=A0AAE1XQU4_9LAMI|nr:hypothetical protein Salat_2700600 [Sesamum alatum]